MRGLLIVLAALTACTTASPGPGGDSETLRVLDAPPEIVAESPPATGRAAREAASLVAAARPARRVEAEATPFLSASPDGRRFLDRAAPGRALAQGAPPARCPAIGVGASPAGDIAAAARAALDRCFADLARLGARDCGCRLLAAGDMLLAPQTAFARAPGVGARLLGAGSTGGRPLVAEEIVADDDPGARLVTLRDAAGVIAIARLEEDGRASLELADGSPRLDGRHTPSGWRRGRLAETVELRDATGRRAVALIGFEPGDLRATAAPSPRNPG